jgi:hypothetical protein
MTGKNYLRVCSYEIFQAILAGYEGPESSSGLTGKQCPRFATQYGRLSQSFGPQ